MNNKYINIHNKNLAITLSYMTRQDFYTFDDLKNKDNKLYSFENNEKLQRAYTIIMNYRNDNK